MQQQTFSEVTFEQYRKPIMNTLEACQLEVYESALAEI